MTSVAPVYVKHSSTNASRNDSQLAYRLCMATSAVVPGHILGARQVRGLWEIHIKTSVARDKLLLKGFIFRENLILLHASDPFAAQHIPSEKITIYRGEGVAIVFKECLQLVKFDCSGKSANLEYITCQTSINKHK